MGVFLIFLALGIISAIVIIIGNVIERKSSFYNLDIFYWVGCIGCACAVIIMIIFGVVALIVGCQRQVKYQQHLLTYQVMSARLEEVDSNNYYLFVDEINEYNNAILEDRYWADNLWVNWYHNGLIKDLPLIGE